MAQDRSILVYDAYRLDKIQSIKDTDSTIVLKFSSVSFDESTGTLFCGCQQVNIWKAEVDSKAEIQALQVQTLSKTLMKERNMDQLMKLSGDQNILTSTSEVKSGKVVVSNKSQLVTVLVNARDSKNLIITVDSDNLLRGWNLSDCSTSFSYKIPFS